MRSVIALYRYKYLHKFFVVKHNKLQFDLAPSPEGEGWGEMNKIKPLGFSLIQTSPFEEGF